MKAIMLMLFTFCFAYSTELLVNGDFEQDLTVGWSEKKLAYYGKFYRGTGIHPDPDYEAEKYILTDCSSGYAYLFQRVNVKNVENVFSASAAIVTFRDEQGQRFGGKKIRSERYENDQM